MRARGLCIVPCGVCSHKRFACLVVVFLLMGSGCGHQPPPTTIIKASASRQLLIKFKPDTIACTPAGIAQLSSTTRVSLEFVRTMSGDACVVKQFADTADNLLHGEKTLKENPAVEYLEPDAVMKTL